ncbi:MAG TPA: hypothetical protein VEA69_20840 [Tepidisphaeraceae bacterium]|nr:hypothetical protein [Tepidisphaeraceae bacterium]
MSHPTNQQRPHAARLGLSIHGLAVDVACDVPAVLDEARRVLWGFEAADTTPGGPGVTSGQIRPYVQAEVVRSLSPRAVPLATPGARAAGHAFELYQEGERFWLVDDRWGLCEINVMRGTWRSWVLPRPTLDIFRVMELAVIWPIAQLLRPRGLYLLPAVSVARSGTGVLILSPLNLEAELRTLVRAGFGVIGQRWSTARETADGGIELLAFPGQIEREATARLREDGAPDGESRWVDLTAEQDGVASSAAPCGAVAVIEPSRRPHAHVSEVTSQRAADLLRRAWPMAELHPFRAHGQLSLKLSHRARCGQVQLSRCPEDMLVMLETVRGPAPGSIVTAATAAGIIAAGVPAPPMARRIVPPTFTPGVRQPPTARWQPVRS